MSDSRSWIMAMRTIALCATLVLSMLAEAHAQQPVPGYQPSRPTLSPYLYLTRPNPGPLPNYQSFVEPAKNQQQLNQVQQTQITQLNTSQQQLQQQQQQLQLQMTPTPMTPTGVGSSFNSLSHYYPTGGSVGGRGKSTPRR